MSGFFNWNIHSRSLEQDLLLRSNPFQRPSDSLLISNRYAESISVFYNRNQPGFGLTANFSRRGNRVLNVNGFESSDKAHNSYSIRYQFSNRVQVEVTSRTGSQTHDTDFLTGRRFFIDENQYAFSGNWMPTLKSRLNLSCRFSDHQNILTELTKEYVKSNQWKAGLTYVESGKRNINTEFTYIDNKFQGTVNSYLGYVLLNGLQPGKNVSVQTSINQTLKNGLQLTLNYFGRKSENQRVIHSGSLNLTAFF